MPPVDPEPDAGPEGREKPPPAGPNAPGGGGAESRWRTGTSGAVRKRFHTDFPLQETFLYFLVAKEPRGAENGGLNTRSSAYDPKTCCWRPEEWREVRRAGGRCGEEWDTPVMGGGGALRGGSNPYY